VWRGLYEEAAGQPALTGGREYKSADMYFRRLRSLNPEMEPAEIFMLAGEGAAFMIASQLEGGVFGWMHKPPDICMLASQAQSVEWHLRKMRGRGGQSGPSTGSGRTDCQSLDSGIGEEGCEGSDSFRPSTGSGRTGHDSNAEFNEAGREGPDGSTGSVLVKFIEKIREVQDAGQEIDRVYGELRGIENASRGRALQPGGRPLRRKRG